MGLVALAVLGLIVFLLGARNEYGDNNSKGEVIHIYLDYALGASMAAIPFLLAPGARRAGAICGRILTALGGF